MSARPKLLIDLPGLRIESFEAAEAAAARRLAFVFTPYENRELGGNPFGGALLVRHGFDVVAFKSSSDDWFQSVPDSVFERLRDWSAGCGHAERVAYGSSMGAYAAIAFSSRLSCSTVLALSPQYSIREAFDTRWAPSARRIAEWRHPIEAGCIAAGCRYVIAYDDRNLDALHVERLQTLIPGARLELLCLPYAGHPVSHYLVDLEQLKPLVLRVLQGDRADLSTCRRSRSRSSMYLSALANANLKRSRPRLALRLTEQALAVAPRARMCAVHRMRSHILQALCQPEAAIEALQAAVSFDAGNPHLRQQLAQRLEEAGRLDEALAQARVAADSGAGNPHFHAYLGRLLLGRGDAAAALSCAQRAVDMDPGVSGFTALRDQARRRLLPASAPIPAHSPADRRRVAQAAERIWLRWLRWFTLGVSRRRN